MEKYWKVIVLCKKHSRISCYGKGATTHCSHQTKGLLGLEHFSHHLYLLKWASVSKSFLKLIYLNNYMYYPKNKCYQLETHPSSIPFSQVIVSQLVSKSPLYIRFPWTFIPGLGPRAWHCMFAASESFQLPSCGTEPHTSTRSNLLRWKNWWGERFHMIHFLCKKWPLWKGHMAYMLILGGRSCS